MERNKAKVLDTLELSETVTGELLRISNREKVSPSDVVSILVHLYYVSGHITEKAMDDFLEMARQGN